MTEIYFYQDKHGKEPVREWLESQDKKCRAKGYALISYLATHGYKSKRPYSAPLRDGIHELRWRYQNVHYRILYSFTGKDIALLCVGCTKIDRVPEKEIELAIRRSKDFI